MEDDGGGGIGGGGIEEGSEKDYDALNDETFGKAINGDWENLHESYVRLDQSSDVKDDDGDSDFGNFLFVWKINFFVLLSFWKMTF